MEDGHVLVIGSAGTNIKAIPHQDMQFGVSNLGHIRNSVGGVARNIAENLARLEVPTILLTALGRDLMAKRVLRTCTRAGIDCTHVRRVKGARTGTNLTVLEPGGDLVTAITDFEIIDYVDSDYLLENEALFASAQMIVIDATLTDDALATVFELAAQYSVRVSADPTTPALASRLCPYMSQLYLVVPNAAETAALCDSPGPAHDRDTATQAARSLVAQGAHIAVVTMGEDGLAYADGGGGGFIRAIKTKVVDSTGAGDAFSGAAIFGLLNGVPVDEAMRLGITAASLTLESRHTVLRELSQELLYEKLMV